MFAQITGKIKTLNDDALDIKTVTTGEILSVRSAEIVYQGQQYDRDINKYVPKYIEMPIYIKKDITVVQDKAYTFYLQFVNGGVNSFERQEHAYAYLVKEQQDFLESPRNFFITCKIRNIEFLSSNYNDKNYLTAKISCVKDGFNRVLKMTVDESRNTAGIYEISTDFIDRDVMIMGVFDYTRYEALNGDETYFISKKIKAIIPFRSPSSGNENTLDVGLSSVGDKIDNTLDMDEIPF